MARGRRGRRRNKRKGGGGEVARAARGQGPTPERLAKAGDDHVRLGADGVVRCDDSVLQRLAQRCALAPGVPDANGRAVPDRALNRVLLEAGEQYYRHCYLSGMIASGALDPAGIRVDCAGAIGQPACGMPLSMAAAHHRKCYRAAAQALGPYFSAAVDPIVLAEQDVAVVGAAISGYRHRHAAAAVAMDRLRGGLARLAVHFELASPRVLGALDSMAMGSHVLRDEAIRARTGTPVPGAAISGAR